MKFIGSNQGLRNLKNEPGLKFITGIALRHLTSLWNPFHFKDVITVHSTYVPWQLQHKVHISILELCQNRQWWSHHPSKPWNCSDPPIPTWPSQADDRHLPSNDGGAAVETPVAPPSQVTLDATVDWLGK